MGQLHPDTFLVANITILTNDHGWLNPQTLIWRLAVNYIQSNSHMVPGPTIYLNKVDLKSSLKRHSMAHFKAVILSCGNFISINGLS